MLAGLRSRVAGFFARPGVTPARVWPVLGLVLGLPALFLGMQIEPMGQSRSSSPGTPVVVNGGGSGSDAADTAPGSTPPSGGSGFSASSSDSSDSDSSGSADSDSDASSDSGTLPSEPLAEPSVAEDDTTDDTDAESEDEDAVDDGTTETFSGAVVRVNQKAQSYTLATANSELIAVHAEELPTVGKPIEAKVSPLANGTYLQAAEPTEVDALEAISFRGYVSWVGGADRPGYVVSTRGVSLWVGTEAVVPVPALGVPILATVTVDPDSGALTHSADYVIEGERTDAPLNVEAIVSAVDATAGTVTLSADDLGETEADIVATADPAAGLDLTKLETGRVVNATVVIAADSTYKLTGWSDDTGSEAADDGTLTAGDQIVEEDAAKLFAAADRLLRILGLD